MEKEKNVKQLRQKTVPSHSLSSSSIWTSLNGEDSCPSKDSQEWDI